MLLAWSDALTAGTFALVGVVIGAVVGALTQGYFEFRREKRDVRQAKRMIAQEVFAASVDLAGMVRSGTTPIALDSETLFLPSEMWREYGAVLARHLKSDSDYQALALFYSGVVTRRASVAQHAGRSPLTAEVTAHIAEERDEGIGCYGILTGESIAWVAASTGLPDA
jgi:hypothetical protein